MRGSMFTVSESCLMGGFLLLESPLGFGYPTARTLQVVTALRVLGGMMIAIGFAVMAYGLFGVVIERRKKS